MQIALYIIFGILVLLFRFFLPSIKGRMGEARVSSILSSLPNDEYKVINNVLLKTDRGSVQIDHVVVSTYGIFVIETKNFKGWITGSEKSNQWIKNMWGNKYPFRNPIKQNKSHIIALKKILGLRDDKFLSIIAFSSASDLKVKTTTPVVYMYEINKEILSYTEQKLKVSDVDSIVAKINSLNIDSSETRKKHVRNVKTNIHVMNSSIRSGICPYCGSKLVGRKGEYGEFIGCSNYPKCKFTKQY